MTNLLRELRIPRWGWALAASVLLIVASFAVRLYGQQRNIVELRERGIRVDFDFEWMASRIPEWMLVRMSERRLEAVALLFGSHPMVVVGGAEFTDADLRRSAALTSIGGLNLRRTQITDAGLVHLAGMNKHTILDLG